QNKELMRRNIRLSTKMKILNCYVFSVLDYGCETWTWNSPMRLKINAFEMWCYRMILGISWRDKVSNKKVMIRVQTELQTELHFIKDMIKRKLEVNARRHQNGFLPIFRLLLHIIKCAIFYDCNKVPTAKSEV